MIPFSKNFRHTFTWVTLESLTYYGLLSLHQVVLFRYTSRELYGVIGTTYALSYMCVYFLLAGFDKALAPFFARYTKNKQTVCSLILYQALPTYAIALSLLSLLYLAKPYLAPKFHYLDFISNGLFILLMGKILIEMTRKGFKAFLNLTYQSHLAAMAEIIAMLIYIVLVWSLFLITGSITLARIFIPLVIAILISILIMAWGVSGWYRQLPATGENINRATHLQFAKNRLFTMGFHMNRLFFTGEFLIPFFSYKFGLPTAGILTLANKIVSTFTIIVRRVFETASNVMLANIQELAQDVRVTMFSFITNWINQVLYALVIFFAINHQRLFVSSNNAYSELGIANLAYAYLFLSLTDSLFIAYEQFYITQERAHYLLGVNLLSLFAFITASFTFTSLSPIQTIILLASIRLFACISLGIYSYARWRIKPSLQVRPLPLIGATAISILFFLLSRSS
jgi:hypothetical protein